MDRDLPRTAGLDLDDPRSALVARMQLRSRAVIDAELRRLARRAPSLSLDDLNLIDAMLEELAESVLLTQLRKAPREAVPLLTHLFRARSEGS